MDLLWFPYSCCFCVLRILRGRRRPAVMPREPHLDRSERFHETIATARAIVTELLAAEIPQARKQHHARDAYHTVYGIRSDLERDDSLNLWREDQLAELARIEADLLEIL